MQIAFTGHRPGKMGGYDNSRNKKFPLWAALTKLLEEIDNPLFISGMALGVDTWIAEYAIEKKIPFKAYIPFEGQENKWFADDVSNYHWILQRAIEIKICSNQGYAAWKMQVRNNCMVDDCDLLIAIWDGSSGGTSNCIKYAKYKKCKILFINPKTLI
jgi:uncharacterized phage-like protein YoqJ